MSASQTLTEQVRNSVTGATDTVTYQEPAPAGTGGCASSTASGEAWATWAYGTTTVVSCTTTGAAAAVDLSGSVQPSMTLTAVNGASGDPTKHTITATRYAGDSSDGLLTFQPPDPTACTTSAGVSSATSSGALRLDG